LRTHQPFDELFRRRNGGEIEEETGICEGLTSSRAGGLKIGITLGPEDLSLIQIHSAAEQGGVRSPVIPVPSSGDIFFLLFVLFFAEFSQGVPLVQDLPG
jgi:hypothetical protein